MTNYYEIIFCRYFQFYFPFYEKKPQTTFKKIEEKSEKLNEKKKKFCSGDGLVYSLCTIENVFFLVYAYAKFDRGYRMNQMAAIY